MDNGSPDNVTANNSSSFKYKSSFFRKSSCFDNKGLLKMQR